MVKRNDVLDIAKGIGICLVIFGHIANGEVPQRVLVFSFHMPLFLIISGYCFKVTSTTGILKKMAKRYLALAYATLLLDVMIQFTVYGKGTPFPDVLEWCKTLALYGGLWINIPIWYLFTLTLCEIICLWCTKLSSRAFPLLIACMILVNESFSWPRRWWVIAVLFAFPFFSVGFWVKKIGKTNMILSYSHPSGLFLLLVSFLMAVYANGFTDTYAMNKGRSYLLFMYTGIVGTYLTIRLSQWIAKRETKIKCIFSFLGRKTFVILITHYYVCRRLIPAILRYIHQTELGENIFFQILVTGGIVGGYYAILRTCERKKAMPR